MTNLMRALLSIVASLAHFFERKQLLDAGKAIAENKALKNVKKAKDAALRATSDTIAKLRDRYNL